jgi:hypothetical protein
MTSAPSLGKQGEVQPQPAPAAEPEGEGDAAADSDGSAGYEDDDFEDDEFESESEEEEVVVEEEMQSPSPAPVQQQEALQPPSATPSPPYAPTTAQLTHTDRSHDTCGTAAAADPQGYDNEQAREAEAAAATEDDDDEEEEEEEEDDDDDEEEEPYMREIAGSLRVLGGRLAQALARVEAAEGAGTPAWVSETAA